MNRKIIMTGPTGHVGCSLAASLLGAGYQVRGIVRQDPSPDIAFYLTGMELFRANLGDPASLARAFDWGEDVTVLHLGANSQMDCTAAEAAQNLVYLQNVLNAADVANARMIIDASSNNASRGIEDDEPYRSIVTGRFDKVDLRSLKRVTPDVDRPVSHYGLAKVEGERKIEKWYCRTNIPTVVLRIGTIKRHDRPDNVRVLSTLLTKRDACRLYGGLIEVGPELGGLFKMYAISRNRYRFYAMPDDDPEWDSPLLPFMPTDDAYVLHARSFGYEV